MHRTWIAGAIALSLLGGCDDDPTGPDLTNIRGTYDAEWEIRISSGGFSFAITCPGTLDVNQQTAGKFSGNYEIQQTEDCERTEGTFSGQIDADQELSLTLLGVGGELPTEGLEGCTIVSADDRLRGTLTGRQLAAEMSVVLDCASETGMERLQVRLGLEATRR